MEENKAIQEWRDRLIKIFGVYHSDGQEYVTCPLCGIKIDELANHMIKELDRAREEGYQSGVLEQTKNVELDFANKLVKMVNKDFVVKDNT